MKTKAKLKLASALVLVLALPIAIQAQTARVAAQDDHAGHTAQAPAPVQAPVAAPATYSYVAQSGDSYTLLVRKAVQTYGKKFDAKISPAAIIFAETHLTQAAGSPHLEIGQKINIPEATVKQWVEEAKKLSGPQEAAWQYYAQFADFNTDAIGQARS